MTFPCFAGRFSLMNSPLSRLMLVFVAASGTAIADEKPVDFNRDIRPILSDKCFFCHGPDSHERKADLRLDTAEGAQAAIVPGDLENSEFIHRISTTDPDDLMPPEDSHKKLTADEVAILTRWIEDGATYSDPWAYVPPVKHSPPQVKDKDWPSNWIDNFVLARLESEELPPSPRADPITLIRRLHFDLTGLPPTPERVESFLSAFANNDESAWQTVVEELLSSPHFGERMAIYWLDLVRYADTVGYHGDQDHRISPYRDYVIRAFNRNLPFDQFTREQIAGDLVPESRKWQKVASGYNRLLQTSHEGGIQAKEYNAIYNADRIRNVSSVWMGATVGCAQCHDHKYDPYTIRDHYALGAFFTDIHDDGFNGNTLPANRQPEMMFYPDEVEKSIADLKAQRNALLPDKSLNEIAGLERELATLESRIKRGKDRKLKEELKERLAAVEAAILACVPDEKKARWKEIEESLAALEKEGRSTMVTESREPRTMRILPRGNWQDDSGEVVEPAVPAFLGKIEMPKGEKADRLDLANWLVDPDNGAGGLTARVMANRFWYLFFGTGISRSLSDFGGQGEPPANPELLDSLAVSFYESGWDVKQAVRLLVTSSAYRQSSIASPELLERDPHNQLVARQSRYRLPAELIRDNALAISGLLVDRIGGDSVKPFQPAGYYRHLNFPKRTYQQHDDDRQWRRGLYVHWQRMFLHPMMKAMDAPSREECTAERPRSNTPNAALVLLNDPTFVEAARVFAQEVVEQESDSAARIEWAFEKALSRSPDNEEHQALANLLAKTEDEYRSNVEAAKQFMENGIAPVPAHADPVELASWTAVTRAILNLNETMTRN